PRRSSDLFIVGRRVGANEEYALDKKNKNESQPYAKSCTSFNLLIRQSIKKTVRQFRFCDTILKNRLNKFQSHSRACLQFPRLTLIFSPTKLHASRPAA